MRMLLDLWRNGAEIRVEAQLDFDRPVEDGFSFCLGRHLHMDRLAWGTQAVEFTVQDGQLSFQEANRYVLPGAPGEGQLQLAYSGAVDGYHTLVTDDLLAVNFYSAWYPSQMPVDACEITVRLHEDYDAVLLARRDAAGLWTYTPGDFDCNILAYRNPRTITGGDVTLYYLGDHDALAGRYCDAYESAAAFCRELYQTPRLQSCNLCILPGDNAFDGYCRRQLIVLGGMTDNMEYIEHLLAHEIAHNWCTGADSDTWEDWLNETTAEWTALLYQLRRGSLAKFDKVIGSKKKRALSLPPIKTADGSRPDGVHDKGVLLFHDIYMQHGPDSIARLLKIFDRLDVKNTACFTAAVEREGLPELAQMISAGVMV